MFRPVRTVRPLLPILAALVAAAWLGTATAQQTHQVQLLIQEVEGSPFPQFFFEPSGLAIEPGDTIEFVAATPHHTVTAYHPRQGKPQRVPDGVGPFSSPVIPVGTSWSYTFDTPGVYDVWCAPHELFGMVMRIVVGEASGPGATVIEEFGPMAVEGSAAAVLNSGPMRPEAILASGAVSWSDVPAEAKVLPPFLQNVEMPPGE